VADVWKRRGRKSKPWIADYMDANGRRHRLAAATKEEAQELLAQKRREAREAGPTIEKPDLTVAAYAQAWQRQIRTELKHSSLKAYDWALETHILRAFGTMKMRDLTHAHVKWFLTQKREGGLARGSVRLLRAVLSAMLGEALDESLIVRNAAKATGSRRKRADSASGQDVQPDRPLSETEVAAVIGAARDHQERALLTLLARAGLRPGEAMALQWSDPNFTQRKILVERAFYDGHLGTTKTGRVRTVDMSQQLAAVLSALYVEREREKLEGRWTEIPMWIFCQRNGQPLRIEDVRAIFDRALKHAGLSGHTTYDLRHTFATLLLAKGAPLTYVALQLGHKKPTITLQYYAHWIPSGDRSFVDSLDDLGTGSLGQPQLAPLFGTTRKKPVYLQENMTESNLNDY
jgi:integrase